MRRALTQVLPLAAIMLVAGGAGGCDRWGVHACTEIGCQDQVSLSVRRADGAPPGLAVSLDLDGRQVECAAPQAGASTACGTDVSLEVRELLSCTEERTQDARILRCVPTGKFEEVISIQGTPARVRVTVQADGTLTERTFEPQYKTVQPNGPDCEPTCRQWSEVWALP